MKNALNINTCSQILRPRSAASGGNDSFTKLLLHADTNFTDSSSLATTVTANGSATTAGSTAKFGAGATLLNGTTDYLTWPSTANYQVGAGDWSIDLWMRAGQVAANVALLADFNGAGSLFSIYIQQNLTALILNVTFTDVSQANITHQTAIAQNTYVHIACVRSGAALNLYLDGIKDNTAYNAGVKTVETLKSAANWTIGRSGDFNGGYFTGNIDEIRWSTGVARWTADFTPPTVAYS